MLAYYNVKGIKILGPSIWNTPAIIKRVANTPNEVVFIDNIQSTDVNLEKNEFVKNYKNLFGELPGSFEVQGYDSAVMLREMINSGAQTRSSLREKLAEASKINGALSPLKISKDREVLRPMLALTVSAGEIKPLSAPEKNTK
jgi:ABC-type branched-subunit amino acid transport system substrate-binding protein